MPMVRCGAGEHFYDNEVHKDCPYCQDENYDPSKASPRRTEMNPGLAEEKAAGANPGRKTELISPAGGSSPAPVSRRTVLISPSKPQADAAPEASKEDFNPMVGWLVVVDGPGKGRDLKIYNGFNAIGRGTDNRIAIDFGDNTISTSKHASLMYDHEENQFFIAHNEGKALTKVNGKLVGGLTELNAYDKIKIGGTLLMFVPLCNDHFTW